MQEGKDSVLESSNVLSLLYWLQWLAPVGQDRVKVTGSENCDGVAAREVMMAQKVFVFDGLCEIQI